VNPFSVLGLAPAFDIDLAALEKTHRELSRALHPDRYVGRGASERREALAKAVEVNEAFRVVRDPVRRAEALFALFGIATGEQNEPKAPPAFLMEVMELREALAEARASKDAARMRELERDVREKLARTEAELGRAFRQAFASGEGGGPDALRADLPKLGELRYYRRFLEEVSAFEDELAGLAF
jgi:molecular chaperone HscB